MTINKLTADALVDGTLDSDAIGPASVTHQKLHSNIISGQTAIGTVDASNDFLLIYDNDATSLKKVPVSSVGATNTDAITEGSSNLYFTNARADARAQLKIDALVDSAPGALNTLNELAAALGDDANFSTTVTNSIATKLPLAGGTMSGDIDGNGNKVLFANVYSQLSDLPSASTYHGMFAHVHATNAAYYAHAGAWVQLANNSNVLPLTGGTLTGDLTLTKSVGDTKLIIEADSDNNDEGDNAFIIFKLDGNYEHSAIWTGNYGGSNDNSLNITNAGVFNRGISFGTSGTNNGWETATERMRIAKNGDITFYGASDNMIWDYSSGEIGIGTDDPEKKLHVISQAVSGKHLDSEADLLVEGGDTRIQVMASDAGNNGSAMILSTVDHHWIHHAHATSSSNTYSLGYYNSSSTNFDSAGQSSEILNIKTDGNVGIGTTSPDKTLTVRGTSGDVVQAKIIYAGTDGNRSGLILQNTHTGGREYGLYVGNNSTGAGLGNSFGIMDNTASAYRMIINSSGNVGIATDSPGYPLQVNGNVDILNVKGNAGNAFVRFTDSDASADFSIGADDGSNAGSGAFILYDRTNSAYRFMVNSSGNVAIGATNPTQTLEVSAGAPTIGLNSPGQVTNKKIVRIAASQYNAGDFSIQQMNDDGTTLGANALTIRADGNIGIGNNSDAKNPPSQIFIARNHSSYNDGNNNKRIDFMANGYTTRNETIGTFHYAYHPVFNQYSWHEIKLGDNSSGTGHSIRYKVIWTTGHASGHGYEEGVCSVVSNHGSVNLPSGANNGQGQPHVRMAYQWRNGSFYGWSSTPNVRFYHSSATGTNAQIYMRVEGHGNHNGSTWDMACCHTIHVELYGSNLVTDRTCRWTGHSTPGDVGSVIGVLTLG